MMSRPLLVLDLDETLVHSELISGTGKHLIVQTENSDAPICHIYIKLRPYLHEFLAYLVSRYDLVIFTASVQNYADTVIDYIDPNGWIKQRYYRSNCINVDNYWVKNLTILNSDLAHTILIDDRPKIFISHVNNVIKIDPWLGQDVDDEELMKLIPLLEHLSLVSDVRSHLEPIPDSVVLTFIQSLMERDTIPSLLKDEIDDELTPLNRNEEIGTDERNKEIGTDDRNKEIITTDDRNKEIITTDDRHEKLNKKISLFTKFLTYVRRKL